MDVIKGYVEVNDEVVEREGENYKSMRGVDGKTKK